MSFKKTHIPTLPHKVNASLEIDRASLPIQKGQFIGLGLGPIQGFPNLLGVHLLQNLNVLDTTLKRLPGHLHADIRAGVLSANDIVMGQTSHIHPCTGANDCSQGASTLACFGSWYTITKLNIYYSFYSHGIFKFLKINYIYFSLMFRLENSLIIYLYQIYTTNWLDS